MNLSRFAERLFPTTGLLWDSSNGPAIRVVSDKGEVSYTHKPVIAKNSGARHLTEAEDNAIGRKLRRRMNKRARGWLPHAKR